MGDTARFGGVRASFHGERRDVRALQWHKRSSSDNNGTLQVAGDRARPGTHVPAEREASASGVSRRFARQGIERGGSPFGLAGAPPFQLHGDPIDVRGKRGKGRSVGFGADPDDHIHRDAYRQEPRSRELSQAAFHPIARYGRLSKARDDQADPSVRPRWKHERGSADPNLEERGSDTLPLLRDSL